MSGDTTNSSETAYEKRQSNLQSNFQGTAKVALRHLQFTESGQNPELHLDPKNIARLVQVFSIEGCHRLDPANHVPALISENVLSRCLQKNSLSKANLLLQKRTPPDLKLDDDIVLSCLHGRHRIAAAQEVLLPIEKWWTVDLYSDSLDLGAQDDIREEYSNARNFCDGDIFRYLRYGQIRQDDCEERRWLARLTECKRKDLKQLQRRAELKSVNDALDKLLPFVGLWPALRIGTNDIDAKLVKEQMYKNNLFSKISDAVTRSQILQNLLETSSLIPSLSTFFEDTKWLEPVAKIIRKLLPTNCKRSNRLAMFQSYAGLNYRTGMIRIKEPGGWRTESGEEAYYMDCAYRQLCMFAWRHFPELIGVAPRKDKGTAKPQVQQINSHSWRRLGVLAKDLGFDSSEITSFANSNPDLLMAHTFLFQARPPEFYKQMKEHWRNPVNQICGILARIKELEDYSHGGDTKG
ncbi:MAG: hypothetical protein Q9216_003224 [Gyalolechia sp. 2 TL-2023]